MCIQLQINFYRELIKIIFQFSSNTFMFFKHKLQPLIKVYILHAHAFNLSRVLIKPAFGICENKDADQLRGNREADQRLCFRYIDSTIPLLPKYKISSL